MPRRKIKFEKDGIYHIVQRGVEKRKIYQKPQDYARFVLALEFFNQENHINLWPLLVTRDKFTGTLSSLEPKNLLDDLEPTVAQKLQQQRKIIKKAAKGLVELLAFCLMPNHFHLIVREIKKGGTSKFMQKLGGYSYYFNKQNDRTGPLFQGPFKSIPIITERQLWNVFCYVHANPIELWEPGWKKFDIKDWRGALKKLDEYKWSSYRDYIGKPTHPYVTQREFFRGFIGKPQDCFSAVRDLVKKRFDIEGFDPSLYE